MNNWDDFPVQKYRNAPDTGNTLHEHAEYHGPARRRGWVITAIAVGLLAAFVVLFAINPTDNDDEPAGSASMVQV